jgi:hypothetical protein
MNDRLKVSFKFSPDDQVLALRESPYARAFTRWWRAGTVLLAVVTGGFAIAQGVLNAGSALASMIWMLVFMVPAIAMMVVPSIQTRLQMSRARRVEAHRTSTMETCTFGPDGFTPASGSSPIPWPMITKVVESERFLLLYHAASHQPEFVPKRDLATTEIANLRQLLRNQFTSRPTLLQLSRWAT